MPLLIPLLIVLCSVLPGSASAETLWTVDVVVSDTDNPPQGSVTVAGQTRTLAFEASGPKQFSAAVSVPPMRLLPIRLAAGGGQAYSDLESVPYGGGRLLFVVAHTGLQRASSPGSALSVARGEALRLGVGVMWLIGVGWLLLGGRLRSQTPTISWAPSQGASALLWLGLAMLWTWPAVLSSEWLMVGRHFDLPGTVWTIGAADRLILGLVDAKTAWPLGADLSRIESFLLLPIATLLSALDPHRVHGLLAVLGIASSAWAAQGFARAVGARPPWTLLAGLGFGFSGLAATALLEGHVYQVVNPWLPLFGLFWWRATGAKGRIRDGLKAGAMFALCLASSAYIGLGALLICVGMLRWNTLRLPQVRYGLATVGLVLGVYAAQYLGGEATGREMLERLHPVSSTLAGLIAPTPELDRALHSTSVVLSAWMAALVLLAPTVLSAKPRTRRLAWIALGGLVLSLLPQLAASADLVLFRIELDLLSGSLLAGALRFPIRMAWVWLLCGGVVAARIATLLAPGWGRLGWVVLGVAVLEAFVRVGMPARQGAQWARSPAVHAQAGGPVFDLIPLGEDDPANLVRWLGNLNCMAQLGHGSTISEDCVQTRSRGTQKRIGSWLVGRLLDPQPKGLEAELAGLGLTGVALHVDLFSPTDGPLLAASLARVDPDPVVDDRSGNRVLLYRVEGPVGSDPVGAFTSLHSRPTLGRASVPSSRSPPLQAGLGWVALIGFGLVAIVWVPLVRRRWGEQA